MHELSIALSIIDMAADEARRRGVRIVSVRLRLGPLSGVVREALQSAFEIAREDSPLAAVDLIIEPAPLAAYCPRCRERRALASVSNLRCPVCGEPTPEIVSGRELEVTALEVVDAPADPSGGGPAESAQAE